MTQADRIIKAFNDKRVSMNRLAHELGRNQSVVAGWKKRGSIPAWWHARVLEVAKRFEVQLAPADFFEAITPEDKPQQVAA